MYTLHINWSVCSLNCFLALGCISTSHGKQMDLAIIVDKSLFPSFPNLKEKLVQYFLDDFNLLGKESGKSLYFIKFDS